MPVYRLLRMLTRVFPLIVLWSLIAAFLLAMVGMFIFWPVSLGLVALGLLGLGLAYVLAKILGGVQHAVARRAVERGACPICGAPLGRPENETAARPCATCAVAFLPDGSERDR